MTKVPGGPQSLSARTGDEAQPFSILLYEDRAHVKEGHFAHWFAQLARELAADGHNVHVLTAVGWALEAEGHTLEGVATLHRSPTICRKTAEWGDRLARGAFKASESLPFASKPLQDLKSVFRGISQLGLIGAIRHREWKLGGPKSVLVMVLSMNVGRIWAYMLAPGAARWVLYEHFKQPAPVKSGLLRRIGSELAGKQELRRRRLGGHVRIAADTKSAGETWTNAYPWMEYSVAPSASKPPSYARLTKEQARKNLELTGTGPFGLHFGVPHSGKDLDTVFSAFAGERTLGHLILAGVGVGQKLEGWRAKHPGSALTKVTVLDGYITEAGKHLLYSAADYAVLSRSSDACNSATLADAVAYGLPICASDGGETSSIVRRHHLGVLFSQGDPDSLRVAAIEAATLCLTPDVKERFFGERSPAVLVRQLLSLALDADLAIDVDLNEEQPQETG